jgi:polyisoprenoid-binding protein YceI
MTRSTVGLWLALAATPLTASGQQARVRVDSGQVRVTCAMTVGGRFEAKTSALNGALTLASSSPAVYNGELTVDLRTLNTGIDLRDDHLRNEYLEVGKGEGFSAAVLSAISLGNVDPDTVQGKTAFTGMLLLHGVKKQIAGQADIKRSAGSMRIDASFPVTLTDFGIAKPQYLGVGVKTEVQVKVSMAVKPESSQTSSR